MEVAKAGFATGAASGGSVAGSGGAAAIAAAAAVRCAELGVRPEEPTLGYSAVAEALCDMFAGDTALAGMPALAMDGGPAAVEAEEA